ncbi:peptidoglycan-binding domain-containing protein [Anaeromicrobium sediminis]|uniref:Peptidoglycan binding-like domain-containing protein n=1 Tax=Anaeromicrobium sediminis TaxID=1478221 RepID=A0A267MGA3_9FIRM|nr:peptidoglycan-binding domain-containing protein [Anaeromicrobium sediminis]PAB58611.1 hypothetical protein CCE28_14095 [Anaeromicrobium sediminis]
MINKKIIAGIISLSLLIQPIIGMSAYAHSTNNTTQILKKGARGQSVVTIQNKLRELGYFNGKATGYFGNITKTSVQKFQRENNLSADGVVGAATLNLLNSKKNKSIQVSRGASRSPVSEWTWFGKIKDIIPRGTVVKVTDVQTGKQFNIKRTYGTNHADSETLTKEDTAIMKSLYNNQWSWKRRPIVVEVAGLKIPGSMAGMPHGSDFINGNNMDGHFDVHFLLSKTHKSNRVEPKHQNAVRIAREFLNK